MSGRLPAAEKVARAAARIVDALGPEAIERAREHHEKVKDGGRFHHVSNGRLVALADAVEAWKAERSGD